MNISTQTQYFADKHGIKNSLEIFSRSPFNFLDISLFGMDNKNDFFGGDDYLKNAAELRALADSYGLKFNQAHAPFVYRYHEEGVLEFAKSQIAKSIRLSGILGVEDIIVHPLHYIPYRGNEEKIFEMNVAYYKQFLPICEEYNIRICTENMWQTDSARHVIIDSICSTPKEFAALIDAVDSPYMGGCLDLGHCALVSINPQDMILALGKKYITALHVHDNNLLEDNHTLPSLGKLNWTAIMESLDKVGYDRYFTLECDSFLFKFTDYESSLAALDLMYKKCQSLFKLTNNN